MEAYLISVSPDAKKRFNIGEELGRYFRHVESFHLTDAQTHGLNQDNFIASGIRKGTDLYELRQAAEAAGRPLEIYPLVEHTASRLPRSLMEAPLHESMRILIEERAVG